MAQKTLQTLGTLLLLVAVAIAGCLEDGGSAQDADTSPTTDDGMNGNMTTNATTPAAPEAAIGVSGDNVTQNDTSYEAPAGANITFDASASTGTNLTFSWDLGDGNTSDAVNVTYSYTAAGNYTVNLTATDEAGQTDSASVNVTIMAAEGPAEDIQRHFEYEGVFLGCEPTATGTCLSVELGPDEEFVDGIWVPLGPAYEGLLLASTVDNQRADSDCWWLDADESIIGEANNVADPCGGVIPEGAAWVFVYSYAEPATHFTVDVTDE